MNELARLLRERILAEGPLTVAAFMSEALGHERFGYYRTRQPLGAAGDFVTAPEISQIFGELVGLWCADVWYRLGAPDPLALVELGPGQGTMLADGLAAVSQVAPAFAAAVELHLVEASPVLRQRQAQTIAALPLARPPQWHEAFDQVPALPFIIIANEFFDALPIHQYIRSDEAWRQRRIGLSDAGDGFVFVDGEAAPDVVPEDLVQAPEGSLFERCFAGEALARAIGGRIAAHGGGALLIDYGHAKSDLGESLQGVAGHRYAPALDRPGEIDLSHHVDFAALTRAAEAGGAQAHGSVPQGLFLGRLGIAERAERLSLGRSGEDADRIASAVRRLVHPGRMGLLFRVLALTAPDQPPPPGFAPRMP